MVRAELATDLQRAALVREAVLMRELQHPAVARVYGVVDEAPHHALVMQYYKRVSGGAGGSAALLPQMGSGLGRTWGRAACGRRSQRAARARFDAPPARLHFRARWTR